MKSENPINVSSLSAVVCYPAGFSSNVLLSSVILRGVVVGERCSPKYFWGEWHSSKCWNRGGETLLPSTIFCDHFCQK